MIYTHPNLKGKLSIKSINGSIVTCHLIDEKKEHNATGELVYPVAICNINNLIQVNTNQLTLTI
jgi:hypothetical protein